MEVTDFPVSIEAVVQSKQNRALLQDILTNADKTAKQTLTPAEYIGWLDSGYLKERIIKAIPSLARVGVSAAFGRLIASRASIRAGEFTIPSFIASVVYNMASQLLTTASIGSITRGWQYMQNAEFPEKRIPDPAAVQKLRDDVADAVILVVQSEMNQAAYQSNFQVQDIVKLGAAAAVVISPVMLMVSSV